MVVNVVVLKSGVRGTLVKMPWPNQQSITVAPGRAAATVQTGCCPAPLGWPRRA